MAKAQPFMTVQLNISRDDVLYAAEMITDTLFDEFEGEVFEMADFSGKQFRSELLEHPVFLKCVRESIESAGAEALDSPWDYMDFDSFYGTKEWRSLFRMFEELQEILDDANKNSTSTACAEAIETLKRAGFKIVKA